MKLKLISKQLIKNYVFIMVIILTLLVSTVFLYWTFNNSQVNKNTFDIDTFLLDYDQGMTYALDRQALEKNDFLIVFDQDYTVLDVYNYDYTVGSVLDLDTFDQISNNEEEFSYYIFEDEYIILLYLAPITPDLVFIIVLIALAGFAFIFITIHLAKKTGKTIIAPLDQLSQGVKAISEGNYDHVIRYHTSNELDEIRDDINHMSQQLKMEIQKRKALESQRNQLILSLSHDIKTPLTNVIGYSQMLLGQDLESQATRQAIEVIHKYGLNAAQLTDELFDFTKINSNDDPLCCQVVDVVEVVRLKLIEYITEFEHLNITYTLNLPPQGVYGALDLIKFYRVLDNLIQNTIKYNHKDFTLTLGLTSTETSIEIILEDIGIGIPQAYHETIFQPMVRVENSRNRALGGTGLGLAIAKQIMLNHKGDIHLDSSYSRGCRFILTLPRLCQEPQDQKK